MVCHAIWNGKKVLVFHSGLKRFSDFSQTYDVDYGFCYTFNYQSLYNTTQMGSDHGLKMIVISDDTEYLATSSEQGIKIVVHYQEQFPFPNVDGYRSATGKAIDLRVTYVKIQETCKIILTKILGNCQQT